MDTFAAFDHKQQHTIPDTDGSLPPSRPPSARTAAPVWRWWATLTHGMRNEIS